MSAPVERLGNGVYRVVHDGRSEIVYVAGTADDRWAFWRGHVFRRTTSPAMRRHASAGDAPQALSAPMPATVIKVLVAPGDEVKKGDTVLILEAMKMELPLRSPADATVTAVHCAERDLVQPDTVLVELA